MPEVENRMVPYEPRLLTGQIDHTLQPPLQAGDGNRYSQHLALQDAPHTDAGNTETQRTIYAEVNQKLDQESRHMFSRDSARYSFYRVNAGQPLVDTHHGSDESSNDGEKTGGKDTTTAASHGQTRPDAGSPDGGDPGKGSQQPESTPSPGRPHVERQPDESAAQYTMRAQREQMEHHMFQQHQMTMAQSDNQFKTQQLVSQQEAMRAERNLMQRMLDESASDAMSRLKDSQEALGRAASA